MASGDKRGGGSERLLESRHLVGLFLAVVLLCCVFFTLGYVMGKSQGSASLRASLDGDAGTDVAAAPKTSPQPAGSGASSSSGSASDSGEWNFPDAKKNPPSPAGGAGGAAAAGSQPITPPVSSPVANPPSGNAVSPAVAPPAAAPVAKPPAAVTPAKPASKPVAAGAVSTAPSRAPSAPAGSNYAPPRIPHGAILLQVAALTKRDDALAMADALQKKNFPAFVLTPTTDNFFRVQVGPYADKQSAVTAIQALQTAGFKPIIKK